MTTSTAAEAERKEERYSSPLVEDQMIVDMLYGAEAMSPGLIEAYCTFTRDNLRDGDRLAVEFKKLIKSYKTYPRTLTHDERMHLLTFVPFVLLKEEKDKKEREKRQRQNQKQNQKPKPKEERETTIGTCELCHNTKTVGYREKTHEVYYQKFPEERGITPEFFHICLKCCEKMKRKVSNLKQDNPCIFKEHEAGEISRDQLMEGLGDQVFRPLDNNND